MKTDPSSLVISVALLNIAILITVPDIGSPRYQRWLKPQKIWRLRSGYISYTLVAPRYTTGGRR